VEPFGDNAPNENPSALGAYEFPPRFPGQYADKETNLHYNYLRDYDAGISRYVQSDPIGLRGGLNSYLYTAAKPLFAVDPTGESWRYVVTAVGTLYQAWQCSRAKSKYDEAVESCRRLCPPPPPLPSGQADLIAMMQYTNGTMNMNVPIDRCVRDRHPDVLWNYVTKCVGAVIPGPVP
jgi:RHS repeat-associated protein